MTANIRKAGELSWVLRVAAIIFMALLSFNLWLLVTRVNDLERKMERKFRPMINVTRASIYNTDGEVVIETHDGKKWNRVKPVPERK